MLSNVQTTPFLLAMVRAGDADDKYVYNVESPEEFKDKRDADCILQLLYDRKIFSNDRSAQVRLPLSVLRYIHFFFLL